MSVQARLRRAENSNSKRIGADGRIIRLADGTICYDGPDDAKWPFRVLWVYVRNAPAHVSRAIASGAFTPTSEQMLARPRDYDMTFHAETREDWKDYIDDLISLMAQVIREDYGGWNEYKN